eukprot:TRINITY_DN1387_c0_g1_i5.p1 TRINITY_DN1387_c0_g1~~TRINITY_DN1387_c0_g1_i5.p1  ORF type:complete len:253 (-),score=44.84 TRINITY_DN1387_c0_g1_i5:108-866(-)
MDVTNPSSIRNAVRDIIEKENSLDIVINNAGKSLVGFVETSTIEQAHNVFDVNFWGAVNVLQAVLPQMRQQKGGKVITISSIASFSYGILHFIMFPGKQIKTNCLRNSPGLSFYNASKAALEALHKTEAPLLREKWNIFLSLVQPSLIKTNTPSLVTKSEVGTVSPPHDDNNIYTKFTSKYLATMEQKLSVCEGVEAFSDFVLSIVHERNPSMCYPFGVFAGRLASSVFVDVSGDSQQKSLTGHVEFVLGGV